ncbi:MAG TPA: lipoprotein [Bacteroidaceae bacterium]|nr:lipoprotein [Bacteroidaceae bacterium]
MKRIVLALSMVALLAGCQNKKQQRLQQQNDSLLTELTQRESEVNEMMESLSEVQAGIDDINRAEDRVSLQAKSTENSLTIREKIKDDMLFISTRMKENKQRIQELTKQLSSTRYSNSKLRKVLEGYKKQLEESQVRIQELTKELAQKNVRIQELDAEVKGMTEAQELLLNAHEKQAETLASQDAKLHEAYFVFGTKSELSKERILDGSKVLENPDFNKDYFTRVDTREFSHINLFAKRAKILTPHPETSYRLVKNDKHQLELYVVDKKAFWGASKYLVIRVY